MQRAIIIARVSTKEQAEDGYSLDAQAKLLRNYRTGDFRIVKEFTIPETASRDQERRLFNEAMSFMKEKNIKILLCEKVDRITRNFKDAVKLDDWLNEDEERQIHFVKQSLVIHKNAKSHEKFQWDIYVAMARQFANNLSEEVKKGMQQKFEEGWWPGGVRLGYLNVATDENTSSKAKRIIKEDPEKWQRLKEGFKLYLTGNHSVDEVNDILYSKGLRSKTGKKIAVGLMHATLRDPFYAGLMRWKDQEKIGNHTAMITLREHKRILQIMFNHNQHASRRRKYNFLLRGFIYCNICGQRYTAEKHVLKRRKLIKVDYYHCSARKKKHSNGGQNVKVEELERQVKEHFKTIQFSQEFINLTIAKTKATFNQRRNTINKDKQALHCRKTAIENKRDVAEEKLFKGIISDEDFARNKDKFKAEIDHIQDQIDELEAQREVDINVVQGGPQTHPQHLQGI